jgi:ABC-2 type transport system permease protein
MNYCRKVWMIMQKELLHIFRDRILFSITVFAALVMTFLLGGIYIQGKVTHMPVVIFDQDQTNLSRTIVRGFEDSERFTLVRFVATYQEMNKTIEKEQAYMGIVIPPHLEEDIKNGKGAEVACIVNNCNLLVSSNMANNANAVIGTLCAGITMKVMEGYGINHTKAYRAVTALSFRSRLWYNPTNSYVVFMLLGLTATIFQQIIMLGVAISFAKEKEQETWRQLIFSDLTPGQLIWGKLLTYFLLYFVNALIICVVNVFYFKIPLRGSVGLFLLTSALFTIVILTFAMFMSVLSQNTAQAIQSMMLVAMPSLLVSGYTWPYQNLPLVLKGLSNVLPLTYFLRAEKAIALMGAGFDVVWPQLAILILMVMIMMPLTVFLVKRNMMRSKAFR